jgi:hypothetical protein
MKPISYEEARKHGIVAKADPSIGAKGPRYRCVKHSPDLGPSVMSIDYEVGYASHSLRVSPGYDTIGQSEEIAISRGGNTVVIPREFAADVALAMSQLGGSDMLNRPFAVSPKHAT